MDADVDIRDFIDVPYVIERPAEPSLLADSVTSALAKMGLQIGQAIIDPAHSSLARLVAKAVPAGMAVLDRSNGRLVGDDAKTTHVVAGPCDLTSYGLSPQPDRSAALDAWFMVGHVVTGTSRVSACSYAGMASIAHGATPDTLAWAADRMEAWEWNGLGRGSVSDVLRTMAGAHTDLSASLAPDRATSRMIASQAIAYADTTSVASIDHEGRESSKAIVGDLTRSALSVGIDPTTWFSDHIDQPTIDRYDALSNGMAVDVTFDPDPRLLQSYLVSAALADDEVATAFREIHRPKTPFTEFETAMSADPRIGDASPDTAGPRFKLREFGTHPQGPSYLPDDRFNDRSQKTAQGVHADLLMVVARASEISTVRFEVVPGTGGVRTDRMQAALKAAGRSKAKVGLHTVGHAIDLVPVDAKGNIDFDSDKGFAAIKVAMQQAAEELNVPIRWGGNFRSIVDKPHFELDRKVYPIPGDRPDPNSLLLAFR